MLWDMVKLLNCFGLGGHHHSDVYFDSSIEKTHHPTHLLLDLSLGCEANSRGWGPGQGQANLPFRPSIAARVLSFCRLPVYQSTIHLYWVRCAVLGTGRDGSRPNWLNLSRRDISSLQTLDPYFLVFILLSSPSGAASRISQRRPLPEKMWFRVGVVYSDRYKVVPSN